LNKLPNGNDGESKRSAFAARDGAPPTESARANAPPKFTPEPVPDNASERMRGRVTRIPCVKGQSEKWIPGRIRNGENDF